MQGLSKKSNFYFLDSPKWEKTNVSNIFLSVKSHD